MRKKDLAYLDVDNIGDVVTNADVEDIPQNYAIDAKGIRFGKEGMVMERRWGTKKFYDNVPTVPATGSIVGGFRFYDKDLAKERDIIITTDPSTNYARIYVNDDTASILANNIGTVNNWIELTRTFTAIVSATPSATTDVTVDINTIKDSLGVTYVLGADELNYYICYNIDRGTVVLVTDSSAVTAGAATITIPNYAGADGLAWVSGNDLVFFRTNWLFNNFYRTTDTDPWATTDLNLSLGTTPHNRWLSVDAQKKVNLALGSSDNPPVMRNLQRIQLSAAKPLFHNGTSYQLTLPANWDSKIMGGLCTHYDSKGTQGTPITTTLANEVVTVENDTNADGIAGSAFMQFDYSVTQTSLGGSKVINLRFAVTLEYDGYQESDPIYRGYFQCPNDYAPAVVINSVSINPATMPRHLTAINFYKAVHDNSIEPKDWVDSDADYVLDYSFPINSDKYNNLGVTTSYVATSGVRWDLLPTSVYCYKLTCGLSIGTGVSFQVGGVQIVYPGTGDEPGYNVGDILTLTGGSGDAQVRVDSIIDYPYLAELITQVSLWNPGTSGYTSTVYATTCNTGYVGGATVLVTSLSPKYTSSTNGTLAGRLAHATDKNRSLVSPAFMVKSSRDQAAVHVVAKDDSTLRLTCYNGSGTHEDDNLPDIVADSNNNLQYLALNGRGYIQGLAISRDTVYVFRNTEAESFDLQSNSQQLFDVDFLAKDSLVKSPYGLTWAGRSALYWMPETGGSIKVLNPKWINKYNGSLMTDNGTTPFITDAYRTAIISGYNPYNRSVIFHYQVNKKDNTAVPSYEYMTAEYEFDKDIWTFKKLGGVALADTVVKYFAQTTKIGTTDSAKLVMGYSGGIIYSPNITGSFPYTDLETAAGATGYGYETDITINIRDLYNQVQQSNLSCFKVDCNGSSIDGTGIFVVEFYANDEVTAFDTQYLPIDKIGEYRNMAERGNIDSLRIKLYLPVTATALANTKKWDISKITLGFNKNNHEGNI
jgi:hypothetical protein